MDDARNPDVPASVRAQVARAWSDLQDMRLRMAMKPAPKPIDVAQSNKIKSAGFASAQVQKAA